MKLYVIDELWTTRPASPAEIKAAARLHTETRVPEHHRHWADDLALLAERLREEPTEYYKEAAAWLAALGADDE